MNQPPIPSPLSAVCSAARFPRFPPPVASNLSTEQERQRSASRYRRMGRNGRMADNRQEWLNTKQTLNTHQAVQVRQGRRQNNGRWNQHCTFVKQTSLKSNTHPPGLFKFDDEDCRHLVRELTSHSLMFDFDESAIKSEDAEVWETLDTQIKTLLESHQIKMLSCKSTACDTRGAYHVLEVPRNDNLVACVMENGQLSEQPHPCWPWRVVSGLPWIQLPQDTSHSRNICIPQCTGTASEEDEQAASQSQPRRRLAAQRNRNRPVQWPQVASSSHAIDARPLTPPAAEGLRGQVPEAAQVQPPTPQATEHPRDRNTSINTGQPPTPPPVEHLKNRGAPVVDWLTPDEVDEWRRDIRTHPRVGDRGVYIRAPDSETLAQTIVALLQRQASDKQDTAGFEPAQDVTVRVPHIASLMNMFPLFRIQGNQQEGSTGIGPIREVYDTALSLRIKDEKRWSASTTGGYHTVNLCSNPAMEDRSLALEYKVDGMMFALYLITVGVGPDPISPFVLYAASVDDIESMQLPKDYALGMVPDDSTAKAACEIFQFCPTDTVKVGDLMGSRLASLAMDHILLGANWVLKARPPKIPMFAERLLAFIGGYLLREDQHQMLQKQMLMKILVGHHNPWTHPHFKAFCDGFNCGPSFGKLLKMPTDEWNADLSYARRLLAAVYNQRIDDASAIANWISWVGTNPAEPINNHFYQLFIMRVHCWLSGIGHPRELVGEYIDCAAYEQDRWDRGLRARLLYKAITGSSLIVGKATIQLAYLPDFHGDALFEAKVCFTTLNVTINSFVRDKLLLQPGNMDSSGAASRFDCWWHVQLLSLATGFNSL
ncbi:hypothetical protein JOM56_005846 [Amanita muscaria]